MVHRHDARGGRDAADHPDQMVPAARSRCDPEHGARRRRDARSTGSTCRLVDVMQFHWWRYESPRVSRRAGAADAAARGRADPRDRADQLRRGASAACCWRTGSRSPRTRSASRCSTAARPARCRRSRQGSRRGDPGLRHARRRLPVRPLGRCQPEPDDIAGLEPDEIQAVHRRRAAAGHVSRRCWRRCAEVARKHDASISNVASAWVLGHAGVTATIIGARLGEAEHRDRQPACLGPARSTTRTVRSIDRGSRCARPDSRRLRRRVPQTAVPDRVGRSQPPSRRAATGVSA